VCCEYARRYVVADAVVNYLIADPPTPLWLITEEVYANSFNGVHDITLPFRIQKQPNLEAIGWRKWLAGAGETAAYLFGCVAVVAARERPNFYQVGTNVISVYGEEELYQLKYRMELLGVPEQRSGILRQCIDTGEALLGVMDSAGDRDPYHDEMSLRLTRGKRWKGFYTNPQWTIGSQARIKSIRHGVIPMTYQPQPGGH
jgi:hypothetical protein